MKDATCRYDLTTIPEPVVRFAPKVGEPLPSPQPGALIWSGKTDPPPVGTRVNVRINGLGYGTIAAYFTEHGYLGVKITLEDRPEWHVKQNPNRDYCLVFGAEIDVEPRVMSAVEIRCEARRLYGEDI